MSNQLWNILPPIQSSRVIDLLEDGNIFEENTFIDKLEGRLLYGQTIQIVTDKQDIDQHCRHFVINTPELQFLVIKQLPILALIDPVFLDKFKHAGKIFGVSVNVDVNMDDTVAYLPSNRILLSLNTATYNRFGIVGKPSSLNRKCQTIPKYHVELNLDESYFKPGKKHYQRVHECLQRLDLRLDFAIKWQPNDKQVSPNSLENFFRSFDSQLAMERCCPSLRSFSNRSVPILTQRMDHTDNVSIDTLLNQCIDWCEAQLAQLDLINIDHEVSGFHLDTNHWTERGNVYCVQLKGFFTAADVNRLRRHLNTACAQSERTGMIVHSFVDAPQCWTGVNRQHYKQLAGDALYGLAQFNGQVLTWATADCYDFGIHTL